MNVMKDIANKIKCPKCGEYFEPSEAFKQQVENQIVTQLNIKHQQELEESIKATEERVKKEQSEKSGLEFEDLKVQLKEKALKLDEMKREELKLRNEKRKLEEAKADFELETQRKLDEERKSIEERVYRKAQEEHKYKDLEKDKVIKDLNTALEEASHKAQQGSQQLQGEVLELDFEKLLKDNFRSDIIKPIEKGVKGADVKQIVITSSGVECGVILWETKRTKAWADSWIKKLKEDLRNAKANIPVIVTATLPKEFTTNLGLKNGVWICDFAVALPLAQLLRKSLVDIGYQKAVSTHRGEKADQLYEYITGYAFRQQIEAMVESYYGLKTQITKERVAYEKMWKEREGQVDKLLFSTANVIGSIQGEIGNNTIQIKGLEILQLDKGEVAKDINEKKSDD